MTRRVIRRRRARLDIEEAAFWYALEADAAVAEQFVAAVETGMHHVAEHPSTGSMRYAEYGVQAGLRFWSLHGFPWLIFYHVDGEVVNVLRVLHAKRDLPRWLQLEE